MPPQSKGDDGKHKKEAASSPLLSLEAVASKNDDEGKREAESKAQEDLEVCLLVDSVGDHQFSQYPGH